MHFSPILAATHTAAKAATETADIGLGDTLPHLLGMALVFITLAILWGICAVSAKVIKTLLPEPAPAPVRTNAAPAIQAGTPPEIIAAITAAVASVSGPESRIVSVKRPSSTWAKAGRQSVLSSHKIR
jgi:sodium pump decarboxylase gamma subunit